MISVPCSRLDMRDLPLEARDFGDGRVGITAEEGLSDEFVGLRLDEFLLCVGCWLLVEGC